MPSSDRPATARPERARRSRRTGTVLLAAVAALGLIVSFAALAAARGRTPLVRAKRLSSGQTVVVNAQGHTLYRLSGETAHHLLCTTAAPPCLTVWVPLPAPSSRSKLVAGPGVHGKLSILHRPDGRLQVMLRGLPLYKFVGDQAAGTAAGEGIHSFGGTWHAVTASASSGAAPAPGGSTPTTPGGSTPTTPTSTTTSPYPGY